MVRTEVPLIDQDGNVILLRITRRPPRRHQRDAREKELVRIRIGLARQAARFQHGFLAVSQQTMSFFAHGAFLSSTVLTHLHTFTISGMD